MYVQQITHKCLKNKNNTVAAMAASIACPLVNTGVFLIGCFLFFMDDAVAIASKIGSSETGVALFIALALGNFLFEIGINLVLCPIIVRLIRIRKTAK